MAIFKPPKNPISVSYYTI